MPKISVLLPVYNADQFLKQTLDSVLAQSFQDFEVIIINDSSTDKSKEIILSYHDTRIRYYENEKNMGVVETANKGIKVCSGKYIMRVDADDVSLPNRFETQYNFMEQHPEIGMCSSWAFVINQNNEKIGKIINQTNSDFISIALLFSVPLIQPAACFKIDFLRNNLYKDVPLAEDYHLWCRLNEETKLANIPEFLIQYRWHNTNISKQKKDLINECKDKVIRDELIKLGISPSEEDLRIHKLSFSFYEFGNEIQLIKPSKDLLASEAWFSELLSANFQKRRYNHDAFIAFLWGRWIVLCIQFKQKRRIFFPSFASYKPHVLYYLFKQLQLMRLKK